VRGGGGSPKDRSGPSSRRSGRAEEAQSRGERIRLFVAVDLPGEARASLAGWAAERARELPVLRVLAADSLHVTLAFLGWRAATDAGHIGRVALAAADEVGELEVGPGAWLPPRRPRVLAVDLDDPAGRLTGLQSRVENALAAEAGFEPEARPFRPHVTVARVRRGERTRADPLPEPPQLRFHPPALTLYRSRLSRSGAEYEPLARVEL
jgi:RNA 2',3'-cyclic 3'-phosphodiesterase